MKNLFRSITGNAGIVLGIVFLVFIILDWFNAYMNFVGNPISICFLIGLCAVSILNGIAVQAKNKGTDFLKMV